MTRQSRSFADAIKEIFLGTALLRKLKVPRVSPVFLICSERCGSNLIRAMLDSHPDVYAPFANHICRDVGGVLHRFGDLRIDANWRFVCEVVLKRMAEALRMPADHDVVRETESQLGSIVNRNFGEILKVLYDRILASSGKRILVVKENHTHAHATFLLQYFPDARFIFQVRDPRDYLVSVRNRSKKRFGNKYGSTLDAITIWNEDQRGGLGLLSHLGPERVYLQRYEDLVSSAETVLRPLCAFLGVEYSDKMLAFYEADEVKARAQPGSPWENLGAPLKEKNFGQYRESLSKIEIEATEHLLGEALTLFGYERSAPPVLSESDRLFRSFFPQILALVERYANHQFVPVGNVRVNEHHIGAIDPTPLPLPYKR